MKIAIFKTYDELPLYLNADTVAKLFGISISSAYELMREKDFPSVRIGKRIARNVYAATREECEAKLAEMIREMKAEIAKMKKAANA